FQERDRANRELERHDWQALAALRKAATANLNLESKRRMERLMAYLAGPVTRLPLRWHRAVELLEWIGSPEAKVLLERLAQGAAESRLTQDAQRALKRFKTRVEPASQFAKMGPAADASAEPLPGGAILRVGTARWQSGSSNG